MATLSLTTAAVREEFKKLRETPSFEDACARFEIWVKNNGADRRDRLSLEWRVRKVQILQDMLQRRLGDLLEDLQLLRDTIGPSELDEEISLDCTQLIEAVHEDISALFKLSAVAKRSTIRDIFAAALTRVGKDEVRSLQDEADDIADRYPRLRQPHLKWLLDRLAQANSQRRRFLLHRQQHQERVATVVQDVAPSENPPEAPPQLDDTASKYSRGLSTATSVDLNHFTRALSQLDDNDDAESLASALSYATTLDDHIFSIKPLSDFSQGRQVFICPYCREEQQIQSQYAWERHVHADLRTYVCTAPDCDLHLFTTSYAWLEHQMEDHLMMCSGCGTAPTTKSGQAAHRCQAHGEWLQRDAISVQECRFCDWSAKIGSEIEARVSLRRYRRHMAAHLEQVTMLTIDHDQIEENDDSDETEHEDLVVRSSTEQKEMLRDWVEAPIAIPSYHKLNRPAYVPAYDAIHEIDGWQKWLSGSVQSICILGMSGSGKSTLLLEIVETLSAWRPVLAFFPDWTARREPLHNILRSLLVQACDQFDDWQLLAESHAAHGDGTIHLDSTQVPPLLSIACSDRPGLVIAVDALDECEDPIVLIQWLSTFLPSRTNIQLVLTSRPQDGIRTHLETFLEPDVILDMQGFRPQVPMDLQAMGLVSRCIREEKPELAQFRRQQNWQSLDADIEAARALVAEIHVSPSAYIQRLYNLSIALYLRDSLSDNATSDLDEVIQLTRKAVNTTGAHEFDHAASFCLLASSLWRRSQPQGVLDDVNGAVLAYKRAVGLTKSDSPDLPARLNDLAMCLGQRYTWHNSLLDIDEAIAILTDVVRATTQSDHALPWRLNNLSILSAIRASKTQMLSDYTRTIIWARDALKCAQSEGDSVVMLEDSLAAALRDRYLAAGEITDLNEAILIAKRLKAK